MTMTWALPLPDFGHDLPAFMLLRTPNAAKKPAIDDGDSEA